MGDSFFYQLEAAGFSVGESTELFGYLTGMAVPLVNLATIFTAAMTINLVPAISESRTLKDAEGIKVKISTAFRVAMIITMPCSVGLYFLAGDVAALIYNAPGAASVIQTMSFGIFLLGLHQISTGILQGLGKTVLPVVAMILAAAIKVGLSIVLVAQPELGINGASIATLADFGIAAVLNMLFIYKHAHYSLSIGGIIKPALAFKAAAVLAVAAVGFGVYAAYAFMRYHGLQQEFADYRAHKAEYEERMQSLLDDNEKMLRDMNEMATLESRLRRALIRDPEAGLQLGTAAQDESTAVKPEYMGQGGPAEMNMPERLGVLEVQNKNIKQQIDDKKASMKELLAAMEKRSNSLNAFPDLWPTEGGVISSDYGGRMAPIGGGYDHGTDWRRLRLAPRHRHCR